MPRRTWIVALLLFGSGLCALLYQTTWLREFRLIFGASTAASAAVLGVFMAGLGFGGIVLGRRAEAKIRPLAFYAKLEFLIAITAAVSPFLVLAARHLYITLGGTETMGMTFGTVARLILAAVIMGVPTFLMGGTLPAAARAVVERDDVSRRSVGILYGINTLGAVTGAVAGTFYLFENFGNHLTLWWAAALNGIVALTAFSYSKSMPDRTPEAKGDGEESPAYANSMFVFCAAGLVGFAFFLMEMVWYRMLAPLLGGSTFSFGIILAVALLGIGLGGVAYALSSLKRSATPQFFALTCAAEAFFIALPYALGDRIAIMAMLLRPLGTAGFAGHIMAWTALCSIVVFPAAFISGLQFPLLIALLGRGGKCIGSQTGAAYAWNTIGALIGALAGGFGLMALFSAPGVWRIVIVLLALLAIVAVSLAFRESRERVGGFVALAFVALALTTLTSTGPTAFWRHSQIGVGRLQMYQGSPNELRDLVHQSRRRIMWETDGIESGVALANADGLAFIVNGKSDGNARTDAGTQIMSGMIGAALHPNPTKAMVVGLGTGSTAGWLAAVPSMQKVDAVELEPAVLKVAQSCAPVNHNALANPKLRVMIGDGRELLLTLRDRYDLIVSEPSNPYRAGVAGLFTREFYQSVEQRLEPGGIFLQWVQTYDVDDRTIEIFYRTLGSVFPNIESWQTQDGDLLLAASREPVSYDVGALRARLATEPFRSALAVAWKATGLEDFLAHYVGNDAVAKTLQNREAWPLNTDDRTIIEFAFARSVGLTNGFKIANLRASAHSAGCDRPRTVRGDIDWTGVNEAQLSMSTRLNRPEQPQTPLTPAQENRASAAIRYNEGDLAGAFRHWRAQREEPKTLVQLALVAECLADQGDAAALGYIEKLGELLPADAEAIQATLYWRQKKEKEAVATLAKFLNDARTDPWTTQDLLRRSMVRAETMANSDQSGEAVRLFYNALRAPFCVWNGETERKLRFLTIAMRLDGNKLGQHTRPAIEAFEPNVMWERQFLISRATCYRAVGSWRSDQARRDVVEFMEQESSMANVGALAHEIESRSVAAVPIHSAN
jgi:spermidine synthase